MSNFARYTVFAALAVAAIAIVSIFIGFLLRIAVVIALLAIAYYWFTRATHVRRNRRWR